MCVDAIETLSDIHLPEYPESRLKVDEAFGVEESVKSVVTTIAKICVTGAILHILTHVRIELVRLALNCRAWKEHDAGYAGGRSNRE